MSYLVHYTGTEWSMLWCINTFQTNFKSSSDCQHLVDMEQWLHYAGSMVAGSTVFMLCNKIGVQFSSASILFHNKCLSVDKNKLFPCYSNTSESKHSLYKNFRTKLCRDGNTYLVKKEDFSPHRRTMWSLCYCTVHAIGYDC